MKKIYYLFIFILLSQISQAQYWKEITKIPAPYISNYWLDVYFLPSDINYGWVCGFSGMVIRTTDGGNTWDGSIVQGANHLEQVFFPTKLIGYTSGVEGIFKSTDGGASWFDVTPPFVSEFWGNEFVDENNGIVVGGGCVNQQKFWKTTDGGTTWSVFLGNEPNSGLTDVYISSPTGLGYAVSSGVLWETNDGGVTWTVKSYSGTKVWQEEFTFFNNSFLFPYAGTDCSGNGGVDGGMRFTTNGGLNWNDFNTTKSMFGAFLVGEKEGWACGDNKLVMYTSDGGLNWFNKSCGLREGDYDDIWFSNKNDGWVVGDGVYHLNKAEFPISKDSLVFRNTCEKNKSIDTVWITNNSFEMSDVDISLSGDGNGTLKILSPKKTTLKMNPCSSIPIVIEFSPTDTNEILEFLNIKFNQFTADEKIYSLPIIAKELFSTIYPETDNIVIDNVRVGLPYIQTLKWFTEFYPEIIISSQNLTFNEDINVKSIIPLTVFKNGTKMEFEIFLQDTGWSETKFKFKTDKCNKDTIITIRAYGRSPIIKCSEISEFKLNCAKAKLDSIEINNTGNDTLNIDGISINPLNSYFKFLGFSDLTKLPVKIPPGKSKTAFIQFTPDTTGNYSCDLSIINNDSTKKEGYKNPYIIKLKGNYERPVFLEKYEIDFGIICINNKTTRNLSFENFGNIDATIFVTNNLQNPFNFNFDQINPPYLVKSKSQITGTFEFNPKKIGDFIDTLIIKFTPCNDSIIVITKGTGISNELEIDPLSIKGVVRVNDSLTYKITVKSKSNLDINISKIRLANNSPNWIFSHDAKLPLLLLSGQETTFNAKFIATQEDKLNTQIIIETESLCNENYSVDVDLASYGRFVQTDPDSFNFGFIKCIPEKKSTVIKIMNSGFKTDTIIKIEFENQDNIFYINNLPKLPYYMEKGDTFKLGIDFYTINEGTFVNKLIIETLQPNGQKFEIPIEGTFKKANTTVLQNIVDFGIIENCESDTKISIDLENSGMLDDTLDISIIGNKGQFYTLPDSIISISSKSSLKLEIGDKINKMLPGINAAKLSLKSRICDNEILIDLKANLIKAELEYNPKSIDLGNIWMDGEKDTNFIIKNLSVIPVQINAVYSSNSDFIINLNLPINLNPSSELSVPIKFKALTEGIKTSEISVIYETKCVDSVKVNIFAMIPEEIYKSKVFIENYTAAAGDEIEIQVKLKNGIDVFQTNRIDFQIDFDHKLFYPKEVYFRNNKNFVNTIFNFSYGKLLFTADNTIASNLLKDSGSIALIKGYALASIPDSTPLVITDFNLNTDKNVNITKENGSLKVVGFCPQTSKFELRLIPKFVSAIDEIVENDNLQISLKSTEAMEIDLQICDINGYMTNLGKINADTEEQIYEFDLSRYSSGIYFLKVESKYSQKSFKFILNK